MTNTTVVLIAAATLASAACSSDGDASVRLSGTVREAETNAAVAGASVGIWSFVPGEPSTRLGLATSDAGGQYAVTARPAPGYAAANCAVMRAVVSAPGYVTLDLPLELVVDTQACSRTAAATANFTLYPDAALAAARGGSSQP